MQEEKEKGRGNNGQRLGGRASIPQYYRNTHHSGEGAAFQGTKLKRSQARGQTIGSLFYSEFFGTGIKPKSNQLQE